MGLLSLFPDGSKIRETILANCDLPIYVIAEDTSCEDGYQWQLCSNVGVSIGEIFDAPDVNSERIYTDMDYDDLFDEVYERMEEKYPEAPHEALELSAEQVMSDYRKYWKKAIIIRVGN